MGVLAPITDAAEWFVGEDKTLLFTVLDSAKAAVNVTGWAIEWVFGRNPDMPPLFKKTIGAGITVLDAAQGRLSVTIAAADTTGLRDATYYHTLWRVDTGTHAVLSYGPATLKQGAS